MEYKLQYSCLEFNCVVLKNKAKEINREGEICNFMQVSKKN